MISREEATKLKKKIIKWNKEYYTFDKPTITDQEYDAALSQLIEFEKLNPSFITKDSPTQNIGGQISKKFEKFNHISKMYSLANAFNIKDLIDFDNRVKKILGSDKDIEYFIELKIDGVSISLHYDNGYFEAGVTRGDGTIGENITNNIKQIKSIPYIIPYKKKIEIRGELFLTKKDFYKLNEKNNFSNPRNAVAGTIRQLNSKIVAQRNISSFLYSIADPIKHNINSQKEVLLFLQKNKFKTNKMGKLCRNINDAIKLITTFEKERKKLPYETDGIVVKVNNNLLHEEIGYTAKFPRFMIAYKFAEKSVETELLDIFPTIGRTGRVTYNAKLSPVKLVGSTISAATLHNANYIRKININIHDRVIIKKAGDIIPKVIKVSKKINNDLWNESLLCPNCNSKLIRYDGEVDQYCINENCAARLEKSISHFASHDAMNIEGLGIEIIRKFIDLKYLYSVSSIYKLRNHYNELTKLPNFGIKSIDNLFKSIKKSKKIDLDKFLFSLGIRHIGQKNARSLAQRFNSIEKIMNAKIDEILLIRDFGKKAASSIVKFFENLQNKKMIEEFILLGVIPTSTQSETINIFNGKTFVLTGTLSKPRKKIEELIFAYNGNISNVVSSKTDYLLVGKNPGSKFERAKSLNVKIINEKELLNLISKGNNEQ